MPRTEHPLGLALVTIISHVVMLPPLLYLYRVGLTVDMMVAGFTFLASFMYHLAESFDMPIILSEGEWHRLDNIGIISAFGVVFVHLSCLTSVQADTIAKMAVLFLTIIIQEKDPWNVWYTFVPVVTYATFPLFSFAFYHRCWPSYNWKELGIGVASLLCATPFFVWGLDDPNDPYRVFHGLWHVAGSLGTYYIWRIVPNPVAVAARRHLARNNFGPHRPHGKHRHEHEPFNIASI